ncbi:PREDICTED: cation channel sperm-associated protein 1 [Chrysochloris asiatica]|uniref:Cation channel sperm-associated protein 1 n=1 Tax=Chrysochloris asiatica TaxID=185453 RepID=A0A9B0TC75_CHRAS|nr:PREDICTED: cation channel sperm-associated protein 1 [Chrysochloris asiatica]
MVGFITELRSISLVCPVIVMKTTTLQPQDQSVNPASSHAIVTTLFSSGKDHSHHIDREYPQGNKIYQRESSFHGESPHHGEELSNNPSSGYRRHSGASHQGEIPQGETYHQDEPVYYEEFHNHHGETPQFGRRLPRRGETYSHQSNEGSFCSSFHHPRGEHHHSKYHHSERLRHGEHPHRGGHHHGQPHHSEHHRREHLRREHHIPDAEYHHGTYQVSGPYLSSSTVTNLHRDMSRIRSSGQFVPPSLSVIHSRSSQTLSKVHPQAAFTSEVENWCEDEQFQKRKIGRTQRAHKKRTEYLTQLLWEKLSFLIQWLRERLLHLTETMAFEIFIFFIICLNTTMMVAQTFAEVEVRGEWYFMAMDSVFLCIYVVEAVIKIIALGSKYFHDAWNNLDFFIMTMAFLDFLLMQLNASFLTNLYNQSNVRLLKVLKSLRALRAIRVLRKFSILNSLQELTGTLAPSLPSITAILILMFTCLFLFSVVLRALFRHSDPVRFQNLFTTLFTLFTMLTLDDWSFIYLDSRSQGAWYIIPILMVYIIIQYFIFLNLVIAVLVDNFQMALLKGLEKVKLERAARFQEKLLDDSLTELSKAELEEQSEETHKQLIEKKFGDMTEKQKELLFHFLQLVAGVEHHQQKFRSQACVIDKIADTAFEAGEEDFRK